MRETKKPTDTPIVYVPVGRDVTARAGDQLMVVLGVCVGVYTGSAPAEVALPGTDTTPPPQPRLTVQHAKGSGRGAAKHPPRQVYSGGPPRKKLAPTVDALRVLLTSHPRLPARTIPALIGPDLAGKSDWILRDSIMYLHQAGEIAKEGARQAVVYIATDKLVRPQEAA